MRHGKRGRKFHRMRGERRAFLRNLANDLVRKGKIETTEARAKEIKPIVEKMVSIAKKQTLASRRLLISRAHSSGIAQKLYEELAPRYQERNGGYLRIIKSGKSRKRDGGRLATIEFV